MTPQLSKGCTKSAFDSLVECRSVLQMIIHNTSIDLDLKKSAQWASNNAWAAIKAMENETNLSR